MVDKDLLNQDSKNRWTTYSINKEITPKNESEIKSEVKNGKCEQTSLHYWYDADEERTVKTSGESDQVYVNSEFAGGRTNTANSHSMYLLTSLPTKAAATPSTSISVVSV